MNTYMITYFISDTCGCGNHENHEHHEHHHHESSEGNIIGKIKSVGQWAHFMPQGYLVKSELSSKDIFNEIETVTNSGDLIFVTRVDKNTTSFKNPAVIDWI